MPQKKNAHAVALGRLGGKIGGKSRSAKKLAACRRNGKKGGYKKPTTEAYSGLNKAESVRLTANAAKPVGAQKIN